MDVLRKPFEHRIAWLTAGVGGLYVAGAILAQAGWRALGLAVLVLVATLGLGGIVIGALRYRLGWVVFAGAIPLALWITLWGSYSFTRDLLGGALGLALAWPVARQLGRWRDPDDLSRRRFLRRFAIVAFGFVWVINSGLDVVFESQSEPRDRNPLQAARIGQARWPGLNVGVALSGGGYRAALMHAGVLAELDAMRVPVSAVSAVSGGSIIGSFYVAGGAPETFRDAVAAGRLNLKRDMADVHNALRLPFPGKIPYLDVELLPGLAFGRVDVQANLVDRVLLGGTTLGELVTADRPRLQICTTDLRTGTGVGLSSDGVAFRTPPRPATVRGGGAMPYTVTRDFHPAIAQDTRVANLVAASGAFPGAFSAVEQTLPPVGDRPARRLLLADGGIVDNWGVGLLLDRARGAAQNDPWRLDALLISAGGRLFEVEEAIPAPEELRRAIDIVYETAGWRPVELVGDTGRPPIVLVQPADVDPETPEYQTFADASTLNDRFTRGEAGHLFELGRMLVRNARDDLEAVLERAAAAQPVPLE